MVASSAGSKDYPYGMQGQSMTDELLGEGNWADFKYRGADPRLGRFFQPDPLKGKYPWNSTYAFQENKLGLGVELEGLELGSLYGNNMWSYQAAQNPGKAPVDISPETRARVFGTLQMIGGTVEIIGSGVGDAFTGGAATVPMAVIFLHGIDNFNTGFNQMVSGQSQQTATHQGVQNSLQFAGVSPNTAATVATYTDFTLGVYGGMYSYTQFSKIIVAKNPSVKINIYGEGETAGFKDVAVNPDYANGRALSSTYKTGSASEIVINNSPMYEKELNEIARLSKEGTKISYSAPDGSKFFADLSKKFEGQMKNFTETTTTIGEGESDYVQKTVTFEVSKK